ncbi:MAG TPA: 16S rRNA (adenine(1518)-N(6)/adenine(1519)-N(6))-dimethyltransferase RsmA [Nitrososphaeraceae archaeon]|nr:16S rRNA (adenine(1518)-N(6)/adenine(1519)-N(6))-dimethyltransferase RsmA [Nitrososphaeraceae archaeon]
MEDDNRKNLGQHFLIDYNIIFKIIEACNVAKNDVVLEFGTGYGYLTKKIAETVRLVYTYEIDKEIYSKAKIYLIQNSNVVIFNQDFFKQEDHEFDFFLSNIPYARSKEIMKWLSVREFREAVIMVQKEFSDKLTALPGNADYSAVSVFSQYCFDIEQLFDVTKNSFHPPPKIDSKVIRLRRKKNNMDHKIISGLEFLFSNKNKNADTLLGSKQYQNKKISQLNVETLVDISNDLINNKRQRI